VRNLVEEIGMPEKRAMEISGHKTRWCFERYHIVPLADIQEGQKMDKWMKEQRTKVNTSATRKRKRKSSSASGRGQQTVGLVQAT